MQHNDEGTQPTPRSTSYTLDVLDAFVARLRHDPRLARSLGIAPKPQDVQLADATEAGLPLPTS